MIDSDRAWHGDGPFYREALVRTDTSSEPSRAPRLIAMS